MLVNLKQRRDVTGLFMFPHVLVIHHSDAETITLSSPRQCDQQLWQSWICTATPFTLRHLDVFSEQGEMVIVENETQRS